LSTIKANAVTSKTTNSALTLSGNGTGGVKVNDYFVQTKGSDIASATSLTLGKDGNQFDVTGTTTITSIATQGIGSHVTLHFDGALTFTHHSTDLILPGAANITTAAGDIAVMYEYASGDWRCVSYTKASGAAVVAGGFTLATEQATTSGGTITFTGVPSGTKLIIIMFEGVTLDTQNDYTLQIGDSGGLETTGYIATAFKIVTTTPSSATATDGFRVTTAGTEPFSGLYYLALKDATNNTWVLSGTGKAGTAQINWAAGDKSLSAEMTQFELGTSGSAVFAAGSINALYI
jgi:hypothetical protein